jgi:SAM-dependent methyltransferase
MEDKKRHWETVYTTKRPDEVSWTQDRPATSLDFIAEAGLALDAPIIDIGGGDGRLVDFLLDAGYTDLTVLDISKAAIDRAKARLGGRADRVHWIVSDIVDFTPQRRYALWHDRATFHFLTRPEEVGGYVAKAALAVSGYMTIGTFNASGPERCSGLPVRRYDMHTLGDTLAGPFEKLRCIEESHLTPFNTTQDFVFCNFRRKSA